MKIKHIKLAVIFAALFALFLSAFAQDTAAAVDSSAYTGLFDFLGADLASLSVKYPLIATVVMIVGSLRLILKPIMTGIQTYVASTPSPDDDAKLAKVQASRWYKVLCYLLDWGASIKVGTQK